MNCILALCAGCFASVILTSIKNTRIIADGYNSIRLGKEAFMIYVGIDIAKLNHFASTLSSDGEVLIKTFKFSNDSDGFFMLLPKSVHLTRTASSLVLNRWLTSTTSYSCSLLPTDTKLLCSIPFKLLLCTRTTYARPRLTRLIHFYC